MFPTTYTPASQRTPAEQEAIVRGIVARHPEFADEHDWAEPGHAAKGFVAAACITLAVVIVSFGAVVAWVRG